MAMIKNNRLIFLGSDGARVSVPVGAVYKSYGYNFIGEVGLTDGCWTIHKDDIASVDELLF